MTQRARTSGRLALFGALLGLLGCLSGTALGLHSVEPQHRAGRPRHTLRRIHVRRLRWNPLFRPSHDSLLLQNAEVDRLQLPRIYDDVQLQQLKDSGDLVPILPSESL